VLRQRGRQRPLGRGERPARRQAHLRHAPRQPSGAPCRRGQLPARRAGLDPASAHRGGARARMERAHRHRSDAAGRLAAASAQRGGDDQRLPRAGRLQGGAPRRPVAWDALPLPRSARSEGARRVSAPREPHLDLSRLAEVGARVDALSPGRASLDPAGRRARTLVELAAAHARHGDAVDAAFVAGLARVADAQAEAFPGNLFWDFDAFAASVYAEARVAADPHALLEEVCGIACELMALFGALSPIRFRYVHDFMYGFDWARWVAREPGARHGVGPFAL